MAPMSATCAGSQKSEISMMGDTFAKTVDTDGRIRFLQFENSTFQEELPANLLCVDKLLFKDDGSERNMDVDFKKQTLHMSVDSTDAYDIVLDRVQGLPLLRMEPLDKSDLLLRMEALNKEVQ